MSVQTLRSFQNKSSEVTYGQHHLWQSEFRLFYIVQSWEVIYAVHQGPAALVGMMVGARTLAKHNHLRVAHPQGVPYSIGG